MPPNGDDSPKAGSTAAGRGPRSWNWSSLPVPVRLCVPLLVLVAGVLMLGTTPEERSDLAATRPVARMRLVPPDEAPSAAGNLLARPVRESNFRSEDGYRYANGLVSWSAADQVVPGSVLIVVVRDRERGTLGRIVTTDVSYPSLVWEERFDQVADTVSWLKPLRDPDGDTFHGNSRQYLQLWGQHTVVMPADGDGAVRVVAEFSAHDGEPVEAVDVGLILVTHDGRWIADLLEGS